MRPSMTDPPQTVRVLNWAIEDDPPEEQQDSNDATAFVYIDGYAAFTDHAFSRSELLEVIAAIDASAATRVREGL